MFNKKEFFLFGFVVLSLFLLFDFVCTLTIHFFNNPFGLSYHPVFFQGVLFGFALMGCYFLAKKEIDKEKVTKNKQVT